MEAVGGIVMRWPWSKPKAEIRQGGGFTALSMLARAEAITGARGAAELTATVQACVSLWEGGLSLARVTGTDMLAPRLLALMARSLALRGEFVGLIDGDAILPAGDWDISTSQGRPRAYRLSLYDAGTAITRTALAAEVVHVVIGADARQPWRGTAPLQRVPLTADLLATIEAALAEVYGAAPLGSVVAPVPEMAEADRNHLASSFRGARGRVLLRESVTTTAAGGPVPQTDWRPNQLSPELDKTEIIAAFDRARDAIAQAYGVDPSMFASAANGGGLRETTRHLAQWTLAPVAVLIGQEMTDKLGLPVALDVIGPLQAFDQGGRARAFAGLVRGIAEAQAAGMTDEQIAGALRLVGLSDPVEG